MSGLNTPLKRRTRRLLNVVAVFLFVSYFASSLDGPTNGFSLPLLALYWFVVFWLKKPTSDVISLRKKKLDERQKALRDKAYRLSYKVFVAYALFVLMAGMFGIGAFHTTFGATTSSITTLLLLVNWYLLFQHASPKLWTLVQDFSCYSSQCL